MKLRERLAGRRSGLQADHNLVVLFRRKDVFRLSAEKSNQVLLVVLEQVAENWKKRKTNK